MKRCIMRYFGGKHRLAPWIIGFFPEHRLYIEPFGGAASVLLAKERSFGEVYNDLDGEIVNFFRVMQSPVLAAELERLVRMTPYAREEYDDAHGICAEPVERARRLLVRANMGFSADSVNLDNPKSGFRNNCTRQWRTPQMDWASYPDYIRDFTARLQGVVIENKNVFELFKYWEKHEDALWYFDPPYVHGTRKDLSHSYKHEMTDDDHHRLIDRIKSLPGMVVISGYRNEIYDSLGWERFDKAAYCGTGGKMRARTESVWVNPAALAMLRRNELLI